jgi:glutamate racemase
MSQQPIGIFDSGIGGLTVLQAVETLLPHENLVYFGDTARVPYGTKSPRTVRQFAIEAVLMLMQHDVKCIVAACNTVSALALHDLKDTFRVPVIGVIDPGVRSAITTTRNGHIGIMATSGTVREHMYAHLLAGYDHHVQVIERACPLLVPLAEEGILDGPIVNLALDRYVQDLPQQVDTLILGCTHYPLLQEAIQAYMGPDIQLVDSPAATAETLQQLLREDELTNTSDDPGRLQLCLSDVQPHYPDLIARFLGRTIEAADIQPMAPVTLGSESS